MNNAWISLVAVCVLVIAVYAYMAQSGAWESWSRDAADDHYNLLVQGFRTGQLSLKKEVPPGLAQLADPYDPSANAVYQDAPYSLLDLSYYKGKLYLYWGVTPALLLFWPFAALTGDYLFDSQAVTIFCAAGFLASVGLLRALWRRYFAEASVGVVAACALALGLATGLPMLLARSQVYEVPVSCGYMLTMLALAGIWCALHGPDRRCRWLAAASMAYGLAVGARPSLLFGGVILLVPVIQAWRERRRVWAVLLAATGPILLIGLGLMLYNARRFDNPFEFGTHYQLNWERLVGRQFFRLRYCWFNFRMYFLEPVRWSAHFPFVQDIAVPPLPSGYGQVTNPFGVLTSIPVVWLALAVPLAWRNRSGQAGSVLRLFATAAALLFGMCVLTLGFYESVNSRYEVDFVPALLLLAVVGILGVERALVDRPVWRRAVQWGWGLLVGFSVAFNVLASVQYYGEGHLEVGTALLRLGRIQQAIDEYEQALRLKPDSSVAHYNIGYALYQVGQAQEAIKEFESAVRINPEYAEAHNGLGGALLRTGNVQKAISHYEQALRIKPDYAEAHYNLGIALAQVGNVSEAIRHWEQTVRLKPDDVEAHYNLGLALVKMGRVPEATEQFDQALRVNPNFVEAREGLERLRALH